LPTYTRATTHLKKKKKKKKRVQKISYMIQQALEIRDFEMEKMIFQDFGEDQS
jgi:hypothetical protein